MAAVLLTLVWTIASAQTPAPAQLKDPAKELKDVVGALSRRIAAEKAKPAPAAGLPDNREISINTGSYANLLDSAIAAAAQAQLRAKAPQVMSAAEQRRIDKQTGSDAETAGSSTIVSKGGVPAVLAVAVERGGLDKSVAGSTMTFRGNPVGIIQAARQQGFIATLPTDEVARYLAKASFSVSFDTSRGSDTTAAGNADDNVLTGSTKQLSQWSLRYELIPPRRQKQSSLEAIGPGGGHWNGAGAEQPRRRANELARLQGLGHDDGCRARGDSRRGQNRGRAHGRDRRVSV
jgi:hypothetical protein